MFLYKITRGSWGIIIELDITITHTIGKNDTEVDEFLYLNTERSPLNKKLHIFFENALKWVYPKLNLKSNLIVNIDSVEFVLTDFQPEGLFFSIATWMYEYFELGNLEYSYSFNKRDNKYAFSFLEKDEYGRELLANAMNSLNNIC